MMKTIIKLKKPAVLSMAMPVAVPVAVATPMPVAVPAPVPVQTKTIIKLRKPVIQESKIPIIQEIKIPVVQEVKKTIIKLKKKVPPPAPGVYVTKAMEAFEAIREYYTLRGQKIPDADIKWYEEELVREKKEFDEFWDYCAETKVNMECVMRGDDDWKTALAINAARQKVKALPVKEDDIGPMPEYGTKDFWAWCHKRKKLKEQKDAAIIAAGGTVKEKKVKPSSKVKPKQVKPQAT